MPLVRLATHVRSALMVTALALTSGCVYYNGVYNARTATRRADVLQQRGQPDSAALQLRRAFDAAEQVLQRHPESPYAPEVRLLAGYAAARLGDCAAAEQRLQAPPPVADSAASQSLRSALALTECEASAQQWARASVHLERAALLVHDGAADADAISALHRWQARVALATGEFARADSVLALLPAADAPWERLSAALSRKAYRDVDAILRARALAGDVRADVDHALRLAARDGELALVSEVVDAFDRSDAPRLSRARLQLLAAELAASAGDSLGAQARYERLATSADSGYALTARARLAATALLAADTPSALRNQLSRGRAETRGVAHFDRAEVSATLYLLLYETVDPSGAAMYLAGEVARDSLRSPALATHAWRTLVSRWPDAPLAPRALLAATYLHADSAPAWRRELTARYPQSAMSALLRDESIDDAADLRAGDVLLEGRWVIATRALADSLRVLRERPSARTVGGRP